MREFLIVGRPNSGKTMFALNFAGYVGSKQVDVTFRTYDGLITSRHFLLEEAKRELCGMVLHKTRSLQSLVLKLSLGKTVVNFKLTDTCGISEQIHHDENIRRGMAQTLSLMRSADFIFHIIDLTTTTKDYLHNINNIDREIYNYGVARHNYILLGNKIDLPVAKGNIPNLASVFSHTNIIPISALHSQGFKEVRTCVARNI
ncbi:MAG TPA: GTPase [Negativicutes bacterium]|jgi:GTPase SAR1 family protein